MNFFKKIFLILFQNTGFLGFINSFNTKIISKLQTLFTTAKILALIIIISAGFYSFFKSSTKTGELLSDWFPRQTPDMSKIALALYSSLFAYSGWLDFKIINFNEKYAF